MLSSFNGQDEDLLSLKSQFDSEWERHLLLIVVGFERVIHTYASF